MAPAGGAGAPPCDDDDMTPAPRRRTTVDEWLAVGAGRAVELVDGELVDKAAPDEPHANAQAGLVGELRPKFNRRGGPEGPGGWWIRTELDILLGDDGFRPDVCGFRRERVPEMPKERPVRLVPDWICEVVSDSNATHDTVRKLRRYHAAGVRHYWIVDPRTESLLVYRHQSDGYLAVLNAERGEIVRAEPFDAIELRVGLLFGEDPDDPR